MCEAAAGNKTPQESADASVKIIKEAIDQKYTK